MPSKVQSRNWTLVPQLSFDNSAIFVSEKQLENTQIYLYFNNSSFSLSGYFVFRYKKLLMTLNSKQV